MPQYYFDKNNIIQIRFSIWDDMRKKRELYPIQHIGPDHYNPNCNCSLCRFDSEVKARNEEAQARDLSKCN